MLYDPKWEAQTKPNMFSLESLTAWLKKQPADKVYCYADAGHCLLAQYFKAMGETQICLGNVTVTFGDRLPVHSLSRAFQKVATGHPRTFGAALKRAHKASA